MLKHSIPWMVALSLLACRTELRAEQPLLRGIQWQNQLAGAIDQARNQNKPLVVCMVSPSDDWSQRLAAMIAQDGQFNALADQAVFLWQDIAQDDPQQNVSVLQRYLDLHAIPAIVVLNCDEKGYYQIGRAIGLRDDLKLAAEVGGLLTRARQEAQRLRGGGPQALTQDQAIAAIKQLGGQVVQDLHTPGQPVSGVSFAGTMITDADLVLVTPFTELQRLDLSRTGITDAGLNHLRGLTKLRDLILPTRTTDAGLANVAGLTQLESLNLIDSQVSDAGLPYLQNLVNLKYVLLNGTRVSREGVRSLQQALPRARIGF